MNLPKEDYSVHTFAFLDGGGPSFHLLFITREQKYDSTLYSYFTRKVQVLPNITLTSLCFSDKGWGNPLRSFIPMRRLKHSTKSRMIFNTKSCNVTIIQSLDILAIDRLWLLLKMVQKFWSIQWPIQKLLVLYWS